MLMITLLLCTRDHFMHCSPRSRKAESSRHKRLDHEMATAVRVGQA